MEFKFFKRGEFDYWALNLHFPHITCRSYLSSIVAPPDQVSSSGPRLQAYSLYASTLIGYFSEEGVDWDIHFQILGFGVSLMRCYGD